MKIYHPVDKNGNEIGFRCPESFVFDKDGKSLTDKIAELNSKIAKIAITSNIPNRIVYNKTDSSMSMYKDDTIISSTNIDRIPDTIVYNEEESKLSMYSGSELLSSTTIVAGGGSAFAPADVTNLAIKIGNGQVTLNWTDPEDSVIEGGTIAKWAGTKLVYKAGSFPETVKDGTMVLDNKVRGKYTTEGFVVSGLSNDVTYYFSLFPYSNTGATNTNVANRISATPKAYTVYGFHINGDESDPTAAVTYIEDAVEKTAASMNFSSGVFNYGGWSKNEFFMPRPCMLNSDGTVAYYLNPNDYTKKEDGTTSDITDTAFDGNAMMEWGRDGKKIWVRVVPDSGSSKSASVYIADKQVDSGYKAWSFINNQGNMVDHFYTPIYNSSYISDKMRSLSDQTCGVSQTADTEIQYAKANNKTSNVLWYTETYADRILINVLLILLCKSLDTQTKFGKGRSSSDNTSAINTGTMNNKGLFWGDDGGVNGVKVFGMEHWWGNIWRRTAGCICEGPNQKIKLTYGTQDGSSASSYNTDGTGYISENTFGGSSGGYISEMTFDATRSIMVPKTAGGSSSTYYADGMWFQSSGTRYAFFGGYWNSGARCGAFFAYLDDAASIADTYRGAALSCKPLS